LSAKATIKWPVPAGYDPGDYAKLCSNGGAGSIDYDTPVDNAIYELFPNGGGIFGFGLAPFGSFPFGLPYSMRTSGFGTAPFGSFPFGLGCTIIEAADTVYTCGSYNYGFACYDQHGNQHEGTPDEETIHMHFAPDAPDELKKYSYDKATDILILEAA